jgi:hypothetical protein
VAAKESEKWEFEVRRCIWRVDVGIARDDRWSIRQSKAGKREREKGHLKILSHPNCTHYMTQEHMTPLPKPPTPISDPHRDLFPLQAARGSVAINKRLAVAKKSSAKDGKIAYSC